MFDYFRIKIWSKVTGNVLYDNMPSMGDGVDPTTLTQGGNIVIHK